MSSDPRAQKDFLKFMKEINDEIADKPLPNNPMSHISFMTEPMKFGGRITAGPQNLDKTPVAPGAKVFALPPLPTIAAPPAIVLPPVPENIANKPQKQ